MRITLLTVGTSGDILPFMALGAGLQRTGHVVRLATHAGYEAMARAQGMDFAPIEGDPRSAFAEARGRLADRGPRAPTYRPFVGLRYFRRTFAEHQPLFRRVLADTTAAIRGAELVICFPLLFVGQMLAEQQGIPCILAALWPVTRTAAFPILALPPLPRFGRAYNLLTYAVAIRAAWLAARPLINWCRQEVHMPPLTAGQFRGQVLGRDHPWLYGFSPRVVPRPADWGPNIHVTGYWFPERPSGWQPGTDLLRFLDAGPPPIYIGFGSMPVGDPHHAASLVARALQQSGQRGVVAAGWGGLVRSGLPGDVHLTDAVPHDWLFPRMTAVVHHGGAGTTAAGLRAGVPSVLVPFYADQPFWGRRVHALDVGPAPIPWRRLTSDVLAAAITAATAPEMRGRATELGRLIRAEDGIGGAVEAIERLVAGIR